MRGRGRDWVEGATWQEYPRTRGVVVGGAEREAKGCRGVAESLVLEADLMLTMDVERSTIRFAVRMIYSSDEARSRFFAASVGAAAAAYPNERAVAHALDRLEGAVAVGAAR